MQPRIENIEPISLIGNKTLMSFANNKTAKLWHDFMPRRYEVPNNIGTDLYSVEIYYDTQFFKEFSPVKEFEKWAAIKVEKIDTVPDDMEPLVIPAGKYVVFTYKGKPSEAQETYQFIYGDWIPNSDYELDDRPHFALMGEKYKGEHQDSEEEFWIPVKEKA